MTLPVWMYWEGPCPDWIRACQETVLCHGGDVRLLGPRDLDQIQDLDRDLDLSSLYVAHRADYVRAFLLARYGGLWVDSDCIVMRPLASTLELLRDHEFVGHFERQGRISNAFLASRPGGRIAVECYRRVKDLIRSGQVLSWLSLGALTLMDTLRDTGAPWHRLSVELVQPVCWSRPEAFFVKDTPEVHEQARNPRSICYMLSNNTVNAYVDSHPGADLLDEGTFFTHLLERSRSGGQSSGPSGSVRSSPVDPPCPSLLAFAVQVLLDVLPHRVLDLSLGWGRWGMLVRDVCENAQGRTHREHWATHLEAVTAFPHWVEEYHHFFYDWIHVADPVDFLQAADDPWDLIVIDELPEKFRAARRRLVEASLDHAGYVLLSTPLAAEVNSNDDGWSASDLVDLQPVRHALETAHSSGHGVFLLSRTDPRNLRKPLEATPLFSRIFHDSLWLEAESRSGPGSSLVQTAVIREEIPKLLASLGVRSLLDVPCGDLNWMRHVELPVERYIGVDVVPELIARNRLELGDDRRRFLTMDAIIDPLPRVDCILSRDWLVHLSFEDGLQAVANLCRSGSSYLLATTFPTLQHNDPIDTGAWRPLNLQRPPFSFPEPLATINEGCTEGNGRYADKSLGLWRLADLLNTT